ICSSAQLSLPPERPTITRSPSSSMAKSTIAFVVRLAMRASSSDVYGIGGWCGLSAGDPRDQMHVAVGAQRLVAGIGVNVAVDGDGDVVELIGELREAAAQLGQHVGNPRRVDRHRLDAARELREAAR